MAADVDIVNRALSKLGESRLTSLDDPSKAARLSRSVYEAVRDTELSLNAWTFAKDRRVMAPDAAAPAFGWKYQYTMPDGCLRILEAGPWPRPVIGSYVGRDTSAYELEGGKILTNFGPTLNVKYIRRVTDAGTYPPAFAEALACKLAMEMSESLAGASGKRELAMREYQYAVKQAKAANAVSIPPVQMADDSWMLAWNRGVE
jgi:hypothetical protein